jgi:hypothetical protein
MEVDIPDIFYIWWAFYCRDRYLTIQQEAIMIVAAKAAWDAKDQYGVRPMLMEAA